MSSESKSDINFANACDVVESIVSGSMRGNIVGATRLSPLREAMRRHRFNSSGGVVELRGLVSQYDALTRRDGFHVLHDWDGTIEQLNPETIPVDVVTFMLDKGVPADAESAVAGIALDYYLMYLLALLSLRIWDSGEADENFHRLDGLLEHLQAANGSGQRFVNGIETLLLVAVSHYESDETAYVRLLRRVASLDSAHRLRFALVLAGIFGSHLRFGFEATYGRDVLAMRKDNGPDYPWLLFALDTLMTAYDGGERGERVVEGLVNGLSPDPRAFVGKAPDSLAAFAEEHARFRALFEDHRRELLVRFEEHRPSNARYSPVSFYFNFLHNTLKAIVVDALFRGESSRVAIDDLLTSFPVSRSKARETMARTLMGYARSSPDRIRGQWVPVIVYDPRKGSRAFSDMIRRVS